MYRWLSWQQSGSGFFFYLQRRLATQKEKWDGIVLNVKATCTYLRGNVCSQMLGAQASTDCDKVPYPFRKGKTPMLKTLKKLDLPGLFGVLENEGVSSSWSSSYQHCTDNLLQCIFSRVGETDALRVTAGDEFQNPPPTLNMLTCRCYCGRQPASWVLQTFPSQNMAGRSKMG